MARRSVSKEPRDRVFKFSLSRSELRELHEMALREHRSVSDFIRQCIFGPKTPGRGGSRLGLRRVSRALLATIAATAAYSLFRAVEVMQQKGIDKAQLARVELIADEIRGMLLRLVGTPVDQGTSTPPEAT